MLFAIAFFFAQAYGCGNYGAVSYNQCPTSTIGQSTSSSAAITSTNATTPSEQTSALPSSGQRSTAPTASASPNRSNALIVGLAHMGYGTLLVFSIAVATLVAIILLVIRRLAQSRKFTQY